MRQAGSLRPFSGAPLPVGFQSVRDGGFSSDLWGRSGASFFEFIGAWVRVRSPTVCLVRFNLVANKSLILSNFIGKHVKLRYEL